MSKPIIRHCRNCEYCNKWTAYLTIDCDVKYKTIKSFWQRITALFCRYYKQKDGGKE